MAIDIRVRYTQMIIKKSFVELLRTKHISKITVKEICELSQINRSTFYKHYQDVYALMEGITEEMNEEFRKVIENSRKLGIKYAVIETLEKIKQEKDTYLPIFSEYSDINLIRKCITHCYDMLAEEGANIFEEFSAEKREQIMGFLSWGGAGMLRTWMENGMEQPTHEVADLIADITVATIKAAKGEK